ncbi:penicillin-binding transpeptidase domain-containing protein [Desulfovibrio sp. TomC]|uniref:penicillin-binding transpeptidase domain-containing protein n=1 Tax=Desulfovibrio sp. TomC TaxID=1562888 RepID=UPI000575A194|nr:penicillin-binding transpeptidase domain-containing protein [Desulfovibrio sp. TomC]KHK02024.1 Beta-lactamase [Desulfovibrio sp. TomC]
MRHATLLLTLFLLAVPAAQAGDAPALVERPDWQAHFAAAGVAGTMALQKDGAPEILVYDAKRAATPFLPASTFKILNSLIALETGVVSGPEEVFPYDGQPRFLPAWNADLTLRQAFALSCVPIYQDIARRIGPERMAWYVVACNYGNASIAGGIDQFWLSGGLRISALEQIEFLKRLHHRQLPFGNAAIDAVLDIMIVGQTGQTTLRAKTGLTARIQPGTAWYVGLVNRGPDTWYFALNLAVPHPDAAAPLAARKDVAMAILRGEGIMQ